MSAISIEQLAEKLGGNLWVKGELKRIYVDAGYNTKKMTTKTYVYQHEDGSFKVSCKVECTSQPWQWCKSHEDEIKEGVYQSIENAVSDTVYIITNKNGAPVDYKGEIVSLCYAEFFLNETAAKKELGNCASYEQYITMPRNEFEAEVERLEAIERPIREQKIAEAAAKAESERLAAETAKKEAAQKLKKSGAQRVKHAKFGIGSIVSVDSNFTEIHFDDAAVGVKKLMTAYVKLEVVND